VKSVCLVFCLLHTQVHQGKLELDNRKQQVEANTAAGGWGSSNSFDPAVSSEELAGLRDTLASTEQMHSQLLQAFLKGLPEAANEVRVVVMLKNLCLWVGVSTGGLHRVAADNTIVRAHQHSQYDFKSRNACDRTLLLLLLGWRRRRSMLRCASCWHVWTSLASTRSSSWAG
jgi:hypothetical protein